MYTNRYLLRQTLGFAVLVCLLTIVKVPQALADNITIGNYSVVNIGGVEVLKDLETGIVSYYNSSVTVAGCSNWMDSPKLALIGGVEVEVDEPGFYQVKYMLEPWYGEFANLGGGQIALLKDLNLNDINVLDKKDTRTVRIVHYSYQPSQEVIFDISKPGSYIIGFGPYEGTLLPKSLITSNANPNVNSIRFRIRRFVDANTLNDDGFQLKRFVDLSIKEKNEQYFVKTILKDHNYTRTSADIPDSAFKSALDDIPDMTPEVRGKILKSFSDVIRAGYSPIHPFSKNVEYAEDRLKELRVVFTNDSYPWNSLDVKEVAAAKIALYLWRLHMKTEESYRMIDDLFKRQEYSTIIDHTITAVRQQLPKLFPKYQTIQTMPEQE